MCKYHLPAVNIVSTNCLLDGFRQTSADFLYLQFLCTLLVIKENLNIIISQFMQHSYRLSLVRKQSRDRCGSKESQTIEGTNKKKAVKTECGVWPTLWILTPNTSTFECMAFLLWKPLQMLKIVMSWRYFYELLALNSCNLLICYVSVLQ